MGRALHRCGGWLALAVSGLLLVCSSAGGAEPIAPPDLQVLMPTGEISIQHKGGERLLEFTHITEDTGEGPLEMRPSYNPATGISQGYQALYSMSSPGDWKFVELVPIVGPMIWTPPSDYNFPLDKFWLYDTNSEGQPGAIVATSPKDLFCMTSDTYVGGVPNTPSENEYPGGECTNPEGRLGLSVGWGDQYEATDGGEGIPITGLPNGTYWLRGEVDPEHYLLESDLANDITDTKLQIEGDTVTVLEQTHPNSTPPNVTLTAPEREATAAGTVPLSASVSGSAPIVSVQFLLDGQPIGAPVTSPPYRFDWTVGDTPAGRHYLSAQATDSSGFVGTAPDTPITVGSRVGSMTIANVVHEAGESSITTPSFSTHAAGDVLLAFADSDGPSTGGQSMTVNGGGLRWSLVQRANAQPGDAEVWEASAAEALSGATVTASAADGGYHGSLTVAVLAGAAGVGHAAAASARTGAPSVGLTSTGTGSVVFATGSDWSRAVKRTLAGGQELLSQDLDKGAGNTFWSQYDTEPSTAGGQAIVTSDTAPVKDRWNMAAVEVLPSSQEPDTEPPTVSIVNPVAGQTVSKTTQVSANAMDNVAIASVQFFVDGEPLGAPVTKPPYAVQWDTDAVPNGPYTLSARATDTSGNVGQSEPVQVMVENPAEEGPCFVVDVTTSAEGTGSATTQNFTTAEAGEQMFAFVSADGPAGAERQSAKVTGAGLKWTLVRRASSHSGDAEIWTATTPKVLKNKRVKATLKSRHYDEQLTVISVQMSDGVGASAGAGAAGGPPEVSLMTTEEGSLVYAVGSDWSSATPRSLGSDQVLLRQELDTASGKTFWSQYLGAVTGPAGELVTLNDTEPTGDEWNMAAVEIRGDGD